MLKSVHVRLSVIFVRFKLEFALCQQISIQLSKFKLYESALYRYASLNDGDTF